MTSVGYSIEYYDARNNKYQVYKSTLHVRSEKFYFLHREITSASLSHFPKFILRKTGDLKWKEFNKPYGFIDS